MAPPPADYGVLDQQKLTDFTMETRDVSPAHLLIKIESFSLISKHGIKEHESREFEAGGYKWKLIIHLNGDVKEEEGGHISAYLSMSDTTSLPVNWEVDAMFNIFLFNQILDNYLCFRGKVRRFHGMNPKWGFSKMISKKNLTEPSNGFIVDDNCVFGAEVFIIKSERVIERLSLLNTSTQPYWIHFKIPRFSKYSGLLYSKEFAADGYIWELCLYPKGKGKGKGKDQRISIFMKLVDSKNFGPHQKLKALLSISITDKSYNTCLFSGNVTSWYTSSSISWGYDEFISITKMRGFLTDDCCYIKTGISVQAVVPDDDTSTSAKTETTGKKNGSNKGGFAKLFKCLS